MSILFRGLWRRQIIDKGELSSLQLQGWTKKCSPGLLNYVPAVSYCFSLNLPETFSQPGTHFLARPCILCLGELSLKTWDMGRWTKTITIQKSLWSRNLFRQCGRPRNLHRDGRVGGGDRRCVGWVCFVASVFAVGFAILGALLRFQLLVHLQQNLKLFGWKGYHQPIQLSCNLASLLFNEVNSQIGHKLGNFSTFIIMWSNRLKLSQLACYTCVTIGSIGLKLLLIIRLSSIKVFFDFPARCGASRSSWRRTLQSWVGCRGRGRTHGNMHPRHSRLTCKHDRFF